MKRHSFDSRKEATEMFQFINLVENRRLKQMYFIRHNYKHGVVIYVVVTSFFIFSRLLLVFIVLHFFFPNLLE